MYGVLSAVGCLVSGREKAFPVEYRNEGGHGSSARDHLLGKTSRAVDAIGAGYRTGPSLTRFLGGRGRECHCCSVAQRQHRTRRESPTSRGEPSTDNGARLGKASRRAMPSATGTNTCMLQRCATTTGRSEVCSTRLRLPLCLCVRAKPVSGTRCHALVKKAFRGLALETWKCGVPETARGVYMHAFSGGNKKKRKKIHFCSLGTRL